MESLSCNTISGCLLICWTHLTLKFVAITLVGKPMQLLEAKIIASLHPPEVKCRAKFNNFLVSWKEITSEITKKMNHDRSGLRSLNESWGRIYLL